MAHTFHLPHVARADAPRLGEALLAAFVAVSAFGGALGLMFGAIDFGATTTGRLPFDSPVFAGIALAVVVGLPALAAAWFAARNEDRTDASAVVAGLALMAWIVVELATIRSFSWLQPLYFVLGAGMFALGQRETQRETKR